MNLTELGHQLIAQQDVSIERLQAIFEGAFFEHGRDADGDLYIRTEDEFGNANQIFVTLDTHGESICFTAVYGFNPAKSDSEKAEFANLLNDHSGLVKFTSADDNHLVCSYVLPFKGGVLPLHIVTVIGHFNRAFELFEVYDDGEMLLSEANQ